MRFASGFVAGCTMGALGLAFAMSDKRTRRKMMKDGRKAMSKANNYFTKF